MESDLDVERAAMSRERSHDRFERARREGCVKMRLSGSVRARIGGPGLGEQFFETINDFVPRKGEVPLESFFAHAASLT